MITKKYYKLIRVNYEDSTYFRIKNTSNSGGTLTLTKTGSPTAPNLEYSTDGTTWTTADLSSTWTLSVPAGGNVYMRGNNSSGFNRSLSSYYTFSMDVAHTATGNIMSLIDKTNFASVTTIPSYSFNYLFKGDTNLTSAAFNIGSVTSISSNGMRYCFKGCTSLTAVPDLSSVTSISDQGLSECFQGCTSLTTAPDLSSVTSIGTNGLYYCFQGCTSLTTAPDLSSVTSIGSSGLYYCFKGCTSLTTAPDLSSVTSIGTNGLYYCFYGCTSLTTAPDLSSVTSIGSEGMSSCFYGCTVLTTAYAPNISTWSTSNFYAWLQSVAASGTVYKPSALTIPSGSSGVPSGWTTQNYD